MKKIKSLKMKESRQTADGKPYTKYTYEVEEGTGVHEATSTREYELGEQVRSWFDGEHNTGVVGKLCQKCLKPWNEKNAIEHEFCHLPKRINQ